MKNTSHTSYSKVAKRFLPLTILLSCAANTHGQNIVNQDFESYTTGTALTFGTTYPWGMRFGAGTSPTPSSVVVVDQTVDSVTSQWAHISNSATDEPTANPILAGVFTNSDHLNVSFSMMIPTDYGNSSQLLFSLGHFDGSTWVEGIEIYLGPNFQSQNHWLGYRDSVGDRVDVGSSTAQAGERMDVALGNINKATGTYDLSWSSSNGANGSATNIAVTNTLANDWNFLSWGEDSAATSESSIFLDNVLVTQVPEPASAGLALGALSLLMLLGRRNRLSL